MGNITNSIYDLERFADESDLRSFCKKHGLNGLELLTVEDLSLGIIPSDLVTGVHLSYYNCWVDFWNGNEARVLAEFENMEEAKRVYGGGREAIVKKYKAELDFAESVGAEYVVFHVSDVSIEESLTYKLLHTDEEVIKATLELISAMLEGGEYSFHFLVENLWWPGLTMTRPEITRLLLNGISYDKKGIMLDIGHFMHTNTALGTQEEGVEFINTMLDAHGELCRFIKGVHLHQSLSGAYVRELIASPPMARGSYFDKLCAAYTHILQIDTHKPFTAGGIRELIDRIAPEFLTYEFMSVSREELEDMLIKQNKAMGRDRFV